MDSSELLPYKCKNPECGTMDHASSLDEIHRRGKLCTVCLAKNRDDKRFGYADKNALARNIIKNSRSSKSSKSVSKPSIVYSCNECGKDTAPLPFKPIQCSSCGSGNILDKSTLGNRILTVKNMTTSSCRTYSNNILDTLKEIANKITSTKDTATLEDLSLVDQVKLLTYLDTKDLDKSEVIAEQRLLVLACNLVHADGLDDLVHAVKPEHDIDAIIAIVPTSLKITIEKTN